jgi:hypothetical protein
MRVRLDASAELIAAYVELSEACKEMFEGFLALQVYGEEGMYPSLPGSPLGSGSAVLHIRMPEIHL